MNFRAKYEPLARQAAISAGINPDLFVRQINQESGFNPNAHSPAGAHGIAQFMPGTAQGMGVNTSDPVSSLNGAARLMARLTKKYGEKGALAAYNGGEGAVPYLEKTGYRYNPNAKPGAWSRETAHYVATIMGGKPSEATKPNTLVAKLTTKTVDKPTVGMPTTAVQSAKAEDPTPAQDFNEATDDDIISYLFGNNDTEDKSADPSPAEDEEITIELPKFDAIKAYSKYAQEEDA